MKQLSERTFYIYNFGCKVNQEEGGALAALFVASGWQQVADPGQAGLIMDNTCTVTQIADKKARNMIRRFAKEQPSAILAVCGCYAQRAAGEIAALGGVDIICGVDQRRQLPQLAEAWSAAETGATAPGAAAGTRLTVAVSDVRQAHEFQRIAAHSRQSRSRAYLKIEDGCDQFCHYCIIPHVRGPVRSLPLDQALEQGRELVDQGHRELVLSGIHIGAYGLDLGQPQALPQLIGQLCRLPGLFRLRLGSIEPQQFTPALLDCLERQPKLCPHLHIPLQSGCDRTLREMGRHYDTAFYARLLGELRQRLGEVAVTTDLMVGYPGETEEDFQSSLAFCLECGFSDMHIFPYSRRSGTPAAQRPDQVAQGLKARRAALLAAAAADMSRAYGESWLGRELTMLVEDRAELEGRSWLRGHSGNYLTLLLPWDDGPETLRRVRCEQWSKNGMLASLCP